MICHPYMFVTENFPSKFTNIFFWGPGLKFPAENGLPKKSRYVAVSWSFTEAHLEHSQTITMELLFRKLFLAKKLHCRCSTGF